MDTLEHMLRKFNPVVSGKPPIQLTGINRTILAQTLNELGFKVGAEIGVAEGYHAEILCREIPKLHLFCVDAWEKYPGYEEYQEPEKCYQEAVERLAPYACEFWRRYSMAAARVFENNTLDFVYIDAAHDFKNVADDIVEWSKKVRPGGIVFGHDYKRHSSKSRFPIHVKDVVDAYMYAHGINPWFVLTNDIKDPTFGHDNPGWMFIKQ